MNQKDQQLKFKVRSSIAENHNYFSSDDEQNDDLICSQIASQIESKYQNQTLELSTTYTDFKKRVASSTQMPFKVPNPTKMKLDPEIIDLTSNYPQKRKAPENYEIMKNKCEALEKQLKRNREMSERIKNEASHKDDEICDLREKIQALASENENLKREKLNHSDEIQMNENLVCENDSLRQQLNELREGEDFDKKMELEEFFYKDQDQLAFDEEHRQITANIFSSSKPLNYIKNVLAGIENNQITIATNDNSYLDNHLLQLTRILAQRMSELNFNNDERSLCYGIISKIIRDVLNDAISVERRRKAENCLENDLAQRRMQKFSEFYFADKKNSSEIHSINEILNPFSWQTALIDHKTLFDGEMKSKNRQILALIAILARTSKDLSEKILTIKCFSENTTAIDLICECSEEIIKSRLLFRHSGFTMSLCELFLSMSLHIGEFKDENLQLINENFFKLFNSILALTTNDAKLVNLIAKALINIIGDKKGQIFTKNLCKNSPASAQAFSYRYQLHQLSRTGCSLTTFCVLVSSVFRYFEEVEVRRVEHLFELTSNMNLISMLLLFKKNHLLFFNAENLQNEESCKCYNFLFNAVSMLNEQCLRSRNLNADKCEIKKN
jgi:hypothetical protein